MIDAAGAGFTVSVRVAVAVHPLVVTVTVYVPAVETEIAALDAPAPLATLDPGKAAADRMAGHPLVGGGRGFSWCVVLDAFQRVRGRYPRAPDGP